jgi:hypothetical protein
VRTTVQLSRGNPGMHVLQVWIVVLFTVARNNMMMGVSYKPVDL